MKPERIEDNPIVKLTFEFSLAVIAYCKLLDAQKEFQLSKQLFRSGTSIGANVCEAQNAESKADFIHKFKLQLKKPMKRNTGYCFVSIQPVSPIALNY